MKILVYILIVFGALFSSLASVAGGEIKDTEHAYGIVEAIDCSANTIVIKERNYDDDTDSNVTYCLNSDTTFENINSLGEIAVGNDVDISYSEQNDDKKIVKFISVYKPELEGEEE